MTPITSSEDEVPLRLGIRTEFSIHPHETLDRLLHEIKYNQARKLAQKILDKEKFFSLKIDKDYGQMQADVIVLTQEEYTNILKAKFKAGMDHARGFMPEYYR
jgi:arginine utilization protein RocB